MERIVLWGSGNVGVKAYEKLKRNFEITAFGDNDIYKQGLIYKGIPVISCDELRKSYKECGIVISLANYYEEAKNLSNSGFSVMGYYDMVQEKILPWQKLNWNDVKMKEKIRLYAGDIYTNFRYYPDDYVICLSLENNNYRCILHDITALYPLEDNSIDSYQIEDVIEHIELEQVIGVLNEIYRILKKGGYLRLSLPDYRSPLVLHNSFVNQKGKPVFDPTGGGRYLDGRVREGGHVWFPTYKMVKHLLEQTNFTDYKFYRYHDELGNSFAVPIDYNMGYISRTKEHTAYKEDISIVVDCFK